LSVEKPGRARGHGPEQRQNQEKAQNACRLRRLNAAEAGANKASARQSLVEQVAQPEQREQHRRQLSRVHRRSSKSTVASQRDDHGRSQVPGRVGQDRFRRRVTTSVSGSAHRRLLAQVNSSVAEVSRLDIVNLSPRHLMADQRVKRAPQEKECRVRKLSRHHRRRSSSNLSSSRSEAARLPARDRGSRKVGRRDNQKKRHRQGRGNFGAITPAAPERENSGAAFFSQAHPTQEM
jgi:hypothetical protein